MNKSKIKYGLWIAVLAVFAMSCNKDVPKDYVTLQGKILNHNGGVITILGNQFSKVIKVEKDGSFQDTLKVKDGFHGLTNGIQQTFLYLKNGYDLTINFDGNTFPAAVEFDGNGSNTNQYLAKKIDFIEKEGLNDIKTIFSMDKATFDQKMKDLGQKADDLLKNAEGLDPEVQRLEVDANIKMLEYFNSNYENEHNKLMAFAPGMPSPKFSYPDVNGKIISLDDLKGKVVYVDVWATWCAPCKYEFPYMKELNTEYANTDLAIVSLSIDEPENKEKWIQMIKDEDLKGIQLWAEDAQNSEFLEAYGVSAIPRFILIDKEGKIVDANAPRPSDPKLKMILKDLNL